MRILPRFLYRAPLLPVGAPLGGPLGELALALANPAPAAQAGYARRAAFRATPHGLWAGVGVGQLGERTGARTGPMRAAVTVSFARLWSLARARLEEPTVREAAALRVAPSLVQDDTAALWLAFGDEEAEQRTAEIDEVLARVLSRAADWIGWPELRDAAAVDDDYLLLLIDEGLLAHDGAPPLVGPAPLAWMAARDPRLAAVAATLATPTPQGLGEAREALAALPGGGPEDPLHAVLVHEGAATLCRAAVERAARLAPLLFRLQEALCPPAAERALDPALGAVVEAITESFGVGAFDLDALALGGYGTPLDIEAEAPPPAPNLAVLRLVFDAIVAALARGDAAAPLDEAALAAVAPALELPHSFELVLTPMRSGRRPPGEGWLVGLHAPAGSSWGRYAHAVGEPLLTALQALVEAEPARCDIDYAPALRYGDLTAHPPLAPLTLALSTWPDAEAVTPAALSLACDGTTYVLQLGDGPLAPTPAWRVRSTTAPRGLYQLLTGLSLYRQHAPWALSLGALADLPRLPRLVLDGFVVAPGSWRPPVAADRRALRRWQRDWGVPRFVQLGREDELLLVDLEAADAPATVRRLAADPAVRAFEIWPPLEEGIDRGGRRLEAVVAVLNEALDAPAPQPRVPPPATSPPAADWHTFKIFGAADRAVGLLCGLLAPALRLAEAAGEIEAWFYLRYVDGPGRRDHLRLRVRGDGSSFGRRLAVALAPAWAAGDVVAVEEAPYYRELGRYGADAITAVEQIFCADSALALTLLTAAKGDPVELLVGSYDALATGAGLDPARRHHLARRRRSAYAIERDENLAAGYRARQRALRQQLSSPAAALLTFTEQVTNAFSSLPPPRREALLPPLLHLSAVRLVGIDRTAELAAYYLWERTRESLARHREG